MYCFDVKEVRGAVMYSGVLNETGHSIFSFTVYREDRKSKVIMN